MVRKIRKGSQPLGAEFMEKEFSGKTHTFSLLIGLVVILGIYWGENSSCTHEIWTFHCM